MIVTARTDYTAAGRSPAAANTETSWTTVFEGSTGYPFSRVMYVNRLELGIFLQQAPSATLPTGLAVERFSNHRRPLHLGRIIAFLVGSLFGILRTVPNRFLSGIGTCYVELFRNVPLIVQFFTGTGGARVPAGKYRHVV